jgi:hypothetical protein
METVTSWFTPARRKSIYDTAAAVLGLFTVLLPILVANGVIESTIATQIINVASGVLGVLAVILARKNVPAPTE